MPSLDVGILEAALTGLEERCRIIAEQIDSIRSALGQTRRAAKRVRQPKPEAQAAGQKPPAKKRRKRRTRAARKFVAEVKVQQEQPAPARKAAKKPARAVNEADQPAAPAAENAGE